MFSMLITLAVPAAGQEALPEGISLPNYEASSYDTLMERTDLGNVAQAARMQLGTGERELKRGLKLSSKAEAMAADDKARAKTLEKAQKAYESADKAFREALAFNADLIPAYAGLGTSLRLRGRVQEALQVHALALRRDPSDMENFSGWTAALLDLNMLGNATSAYADYAETNPERAAVLMTAIETWLAAKTANPGDLDPADIRRLADWVEQQKQG
jgi:tetratricopeptide (TPR) repeat protein